MATVNEKMTALADEIRAKANRTDTLTIDEMTTAVQSIEVGTNTSDATAAADEIFAGETAYTADGKVTGTFTIENELTEQFDLISQISTLVATKATPQGGTDTSDATATAGDILSGKTAYVNGEKITGTIATKAAATITPGTSNQTIASGVYLTGTQTIKGDANLTADNIKSGVSIFGVTGSYEGSGGSGGGIITCPLQVVINSNYGAMVEIAYTKVENGLLVSERKNGSTSFTENNVAAGSLLYINAYTLHMGPGGSEVVSSNATLIHAASGVSAYQMPSDGSTVTLTIN